MTRQIQAVCDSFGKISCAKYRKLQCLNAYGLLILARSLLPEEAFQQIALPKAANFSQEYFAWRLDRPEPENRLYFPYPKPLSAVNQILLQPVAVQQIYQPHLHMDHPHPAQKRNIWCLNEDAMLEAFSRDLEGPPGPDHSISLSIS